MQLWNLKILQIYEPIIVPMLAHEAVPVADSHAASPMTTFQMLHSTPDSAPYVWQREFLPDSASMSLLVTRFVQEAAAIQAERARGPGEPVTTNPKLGAPTEGAGDPASPASQHSEGYEEMLDRHHESLIERTLGSPQQGKQLIPYLLHRLRTCTTRMVSTADYKRI